MMNGSCASKLEASGCHGVVVEAAVVVVQVVSRWPSVVVVVFPDLHLHAAA